MYYLNASAVRQLRENKGWSQQALANKTGLSVRVIKKVEAWESVALTTVNWIAQGLGVEPNDILCQSPKLPLPNRPDHFFGRDNDLEELKKRLFVGKAIKPEKVLAIVRGWPGIGKSTLAITFAYDTLVACYFSDGVLWTSLGPEPERFDQLMKWGRELGLPHEVLTKSTSIEAISAQLRAALLDKRVLLIIDDVWDPADAYPFRIGGLDCATLITTREFKTAEALCTAPDDIYLLPVLDNEAALALLKKHAGSAFTKYEDKCNDLVHELEGLPLSLHVAGRLLFKEQSLGGAAIDQLIADIRDGVALLQAKPPLELLGVSRPDKAVLTVMALLEKSTDRLNLETRKRFALLGPYVPKPTKFDLEDIAYQWEITDPMPTVRELIDRGLLEPVEEDGHTRYQMHALLHAHAKALLASFH